ncbi:pyrroline-5-carboxylate reductase [Rhodohalobacter sp. SW132]|uniref:pyrroline-5-carboxylate reductase n=1 Tax=Rhodohalobacter sp. SW132 TaxID=2293433 RepID=UPI000E221E31|nr:pyrroline-5-carboxylate reductase [Rhodohalobacter sp. SW132]REL33410.1 pyrroline-5-carboxylate reductase [Rhodohalobacter sp. SW132]
MSTSIAILGAGNIGTAIATGLVSSGTYTAPSITLTRRRIKLLEPFSEKGFNVTTSNKEAIDQSDIIIVAVEPSQIDELLKQISGFLDSGRHTLISVVSGVNIGHMKSIVSPDLPVVRAMPNTAIAIGESMTCICTDNGNAEVLEMATQIFNAVGKTVTIMEEQMTAATALCACGIAFFLRSIRAASQGGTEIGFHAHEALEMAAQTAKGAASLLADKANHPEYEIDRVTTPRGCTISGLNEMEHSGFSSAMIKGILLSAKKAEGLHKADDES